MKINFTHYTKFKTPVTFKQNSLKQKQQSQMPDVSVVIPVFKATIPQFIAAYTSLINQTLKNMQFIFVNDHITDDNNPMKKIMEDLSKGEDSTVKYDNRVKIENLPQNHGPGYARNIGIQNATGKYIGFMDTDDIIHPQMYEILYNEAQKHNSNVVITGFKHFTDAQTNEILNICITPPQKHSKEDNSKETQEMFIHNADTINLPEEIFDFAPVVWNKLYKKDWLNNKSISFPEAYLLEDAPFNLRAILLNKNIFFVDKLLYFYRYTMNSLSNHRNDKIKAIDTSNISQVEILEQQRKTDLLFDNVYPLLNSISLSSLDNIENKQKLDNYIGYSFAQGYKKSKVPKYYFTKAQKTLSTEHYKIFEKLLKLQNLI